METVLERIAMEVDEEQIRDLCRRNHIAKLWFGDIFVVPSWLWHQHEAGPGDDAILFAMTDWPTLTSLQLYREELG